MQQCPKGLLAAGMSAALLLAACATDGTAQVDKQDKGKKDDSAAWKQVDIVTVDKVELKGKFYAGKGKDKDAPCVLMLHAWGESSDNKEWNNLARKLQDKYPVLTFDFRGHGESTTVQPGMPNYKNPQLSVKGFWDELANQQNVKGYVASKPRPTEIKYENFSNAYWTYLCNDIAAAKAWLDDQPDVNSNNLILIGAKDGALLGAAWLNSEYHRYKNLTPMQPLQFAKLDVQNPEGQAVAGCVWLTMPVSGGTSKNVIDVRPILETPGKLWKVPMYFLYGQGDDKGKSVATGCEKYLASSDKDKKLTGSKMIERAEKSSGRDLLLYDATSVIVDYLDLLPPSKMAKAPRATGQDGYVWTIALANGRLQPYVAKEPNAKSVVYSNYVSFFK
jgi:pimeloyl-ACP methyl ester carboxylesterase